MRVLLVHTPRLVWGRHGLERAFVNVPAVGLYGIGSHLERRGHQPTLLHVGVELLRDRAFRLARRVRAGGYGLVGLSLQWHHQLPGVLDLAVEVKRSCPGVFVVVGGLTATAFADEVLEACAGVDAVVRGEGEEPLAALATALEQGRSLREVPNLAYRAGGGVRRNRVSFVADEAFFRGLSFADTGLWARPAEARQPYGFDPRTQPASDYVSSDVFYLAVGRGCSRGCCYCGGSAAAHRRLAGRRGVTFRPPADVVADLRRVAAGGYRCAYVCFDPPPRSHDYYLDLFQRLERERLAIGFEFEAYAPHGRAFWEAMARAFEPGRSLVVFSPDTESEAVRRRVKGYGYGNAELEHELACLKALGFRRGAYFSVCPGEDAAQARRTAAWMAKLRERYGAATWPHAIEIEPHAAWQRNPQRWGLRRPRTTFEDFLRWHRQAGAGGGAEPDVGYELAGLRERFRILSAGLSSPPSPARARRPRA
jgi:clorobiocin biosynthesis protein CloN6